MPATINNALLNEVLWLVEALGFENFAEFAKSQGDAEWTAMGLWEANGMAIATPSAFFKMCFIFSPPRVFRFNS